MDNEQQKSDAPREDPAAKAVEPEVKAVEPEVKAVEPEVKAVEPEVKAVEPEVKAVDAPQRPAVPAKAAEDNDGVREIARGGRGQAIRRYWPFAVLGASTVVLGVGLYLAIDGAKDEKKPPPAQAAKPPTGPLETFTDREAGFTLRYPQAWQRVPVPPEAPDLRLVLSVQGGGGSGTSNPAGGDGMWVRFFPPDKIDQKISEFDAEITGLTGDKPCGTQGSPCLSQEQVSVSGMNGVRYVYTSPADGGDEQPVHVQYFLRRGAGNLYVLVFQAIPAADLEGLAPAFDEVLAGFQGT